MAATWLPIIFRTRCDFDSNTRWTPARLLNCLHCGHAKARRDSLCTTKRTTSTSTSGCNLRMPWQGLKEIGQQRTNGRGLFRFLSQNTWRPPALFWWISPILRTRLSESVSGAGYGSIRMQKMLSQSTRKRKEIARRKRERKKKRKRRKTKKNRRS